MERHGLGDLFPGASSSAPVSVSAGPRLADLSRLRKASRSFASGRLPGLAAMTRPATPVRDATASAVRAGWVTMSATPNHAQPDRAQEPDSLRSLRAGAVWSALPAREQHPLLWLLAGDILTARMASLLVYGSLRIAQRWLSRLVEFGLPRGFWTAGAQRPRGRSAYALTRAAQLDVERLDWPEGRPDRSPDLLASAPIQHSWRPTICSRPSCAPRTELGEGIFADRGQDSSSPRRPARYLTRSSRRCLAPARMSAVLVGGW